MKNRRGRGPRRMTTPREDRLVRRKALSDRKISARALCTELHYGIGLELSPSTVHNRIHEIGLFGRVALKKPMLSRVNRIKRIHWAREMLDRPPSFWETIVWTDESKFELIKSNRRQYVWRRPHEKLKRVCLTTTVHSGGGSIMVWGAFSASGVGLLHRMEGIMNARMVSTFQFLHNILCVRDSLIGFLI